MSTRTRALRVAEAIALRNLTRARQVYARTVGTPDTVDAAASNVARAARRYEEARAARKLAESACVR